MAPGVHNAYSATLIVVTTCQEWRVQAGTHQSVTVLSLSCNICAFARQGSL